MPLRLEMVPVNLCDKVRYLRSVRLNVDRCRKLALKMVELVLMSRCSKDDIAPISDGTVPVK
jgi:hypothetical protein